MPCDRSTPAHAGNTGSLKRGGCGVAVYPRPRGEYMEYCPAGVSIKGLPPPTRGIPYIAV